MLNIKHRTEIISVIAALCIAIFVVIASLFMANTISALDGEVNNYIDRAASQKCDIVESAIRNDVNTVKNFAACASNYKTTDENLVIKMIKDLENSCSTIDAFIIADENGDVITSKNISKNISAREYYKRAMNGEVYISKAIYSEPDEKMVNAIAAPIYGDYKRIVGMVAGICDTRSYNNLIDMSFGGKENDSNGYVLNSDGEVIMSGENALGDYVPMGDLFFSSDILAGVEESVRNSVKDNFAKVGGSGIVKSVCKGEKYVAYYSGMSGFDNLHYLLIFKENVVAAEQNHYTMMNILMYAFFVLILIIVITAYIVIVRVSFRRLTKANEEVSRIAYTDSITGYSTWDKFVLDAKSLLRHEYRRYALVSFDIDKFKAINDMYGHEEGNRVLKLIADTVNRNLQDGETFSRINSDNYYILMLYSSDSDTARRIGSLIQAIEYEITEFVPVLSFGIYRITDKSVSIRRMGDLADIAKRTVKYGDASAYTFYSESMLEKMREEKRIENEMQTALDMHEFCVFYQPKVSLDGKVNLTGAEALVRWIKDGTVISPGKFIPLFEKNRFIVKLDYYIMDQVCQKIKQWESYYPHLLISVNMSRAHLRDPQFVEKLNDICLSHGVSTSSIEIEITESAAYGSLDVLTAVFKQLRDYGFHISIDDFGSGYSSLNMLKDLPADVLKIDRAFLAESNSNKRANDILGYVIRMAGSLGMHTICEGIETDEQAKLLGGLGCEMAQGFYFAKPMPSDSFEEILRGNSKTINIPSNNPEEDK
ncbi:MAG: EAL domain-containing protein [[Eubacterium] siraeum]|jgi:diguanylate cyclase (GGDEF) domain|uniref:Bacteriophytochrome cph2 n=1 Tax=[Eubacterium] siraeum TaxID=39492 RepID=A0A174ZYV3_9FIRM|nr:EAL domain-containing protein [[Eubacterium] siraeum]CUQ92573.1 Bacteriophytochrome cph2 [[Eubacterium] siraeum]